MFLSISRWLTSSILIIVCVRVFPFSERREAISGISLLWCFVWCWIWLLSMSRVRMEISVIPPCHSLGIYVAPGCADLAGYITLSRTPHGQGSVYLYHTWGSRGSPKNQFLFQREPTVSLPNRYLGLSSALQYLISPYLTNWYYAAQ